MRSQAERPAQGRSGISVAVRSRLDQALTFRGHGRLLLKLLNPRISAEPQETRGPAINFSRIRFRKSEYDFGPAGQNGAIMGASSPAGAGSSAEISEQRDVVYKGRIRVLVAKPGLDGHDRGAKVIARALRDAGMEVIYTGLRQSPEMIVRAALEEDVDVIGLSILSGAHNAIVPRISELLKQKNMHDVLLLVGGIIPEQDVAALKAAGVHAVFRPGTTLEEIVRFIRENTRRHGVAA
jgi:methylmalonyl-CoA mutase, C-terminal domain